MAKRRAERANGTLGTGSISLIDGSGLEWFLNTDVTFTTSSSASGAMSDASYTTSVTATTSGGGTTTSTLTNAYDGYEAMCVSLSGGTGPCSTGGGGGASAPVRERQTGASGYFIYNQTGSAPVPDVACGSRQYVFPILSTGGLQMQRKVFVPSNDSFARWLNIFTNTSGVPITFNMITSNNLGSSDTTRIVTSSNGNASAEVSDTWLTTFQDFDAFGESEEPRLGHVFQGPGAPVGLAGISFVDGDDNPFWSYTITLAPGQTRIIMNFGVGQPSNFASAAKSAQLANLVFPATACMSAVELSQVANFNAQAIVVPTLGPAALALLGLALALVGFVVVRRLI